MTDAIEHSSDPGTDEPAGDEGALGALDIGTNSIHLVIARPVGDTGFEVLTREKESVRLGHGGGDMKHLEPEAIERGVACLRRMARIAESFAAPVRAVATSATREASNADQLIVRALDEAGIDIEIVSGVEEARLIHLGVLQAVPIFDQRVLVVDIGGGSTEVLIGQGTDVLAARSFKVGAVRLTDRYFPGGKISDEALERCRNHVADVIGHFLPEIERHGFDVAIVSSGTAESIAKMVHARASDTGLVTYNCFELSDADLRKVLDELTSHTTAKRRTAVPGLEPARADIIVAGALILDTLATRFGVERFVYSEDALREGVLLDSIARRRDRPDRDPMPHLRDVARRGVARLMERCDEDPVHSEHVARLALSLFDDLADLHALGGVERGYLEAGALLANVGLVVSHSKHHLHSYYVIRNSELPGFTDAEIEIVALVARYHRKSRPKPSHLPYATLPEATQRTVRVLAGILRVAIGLDRSHDGRVLEVHVSDDERRIRLDVVADDDVGLEIYAARQRADLLAQELGRAVEVEPAPPDR